MRRLIMLTAAFSFMFLSAADARILRGYDTIHHAPAIIGVRAPERGERELNIYFHKIFAGGPPLYKVSALDRRRYDLLAESASLTLAADDQDSYVIAPEEKVLRFRSGLFFDAETSVREFVLPSDAVVAIENAETVSLAFAFDDGSVYDYTLSRATLREWKKIIAAEK